MIGSIAGLAATPLGVLLFLNVFGATNVQKIFGIPILLLSALVLLALQIANIFDSHVQGHTVVVAYSVHILSALPSWIYLISPVLTLPAAMIAALPTMFACFIFLEALWSLFMFA